MVNFIPPLIDHVLYLIDNINNNKLDNNIHVNIISFIGRNYMKGVRENTHFEYDLKFELLIDKIKQIKYMILKLLPYNKHDYYGNWKYITFDSLLDVN